RRRLGGGREGRAGWRPIPSPPSGSTTRPRATKWRPSGWSRSTASGGRSATPGAWRPTPRPACSGCATAGRRTGASGSSTATSTSTSSWPGWRPRASGPRMLAEPELAERLVDEVGAWRFDPLGFVLYAFPWGEAGSPLAGEHGPEPWQRALLAKLGEDLRTGSEAVRFATASGHGIGKSALVAWPILSAL